MLQNWLVCNNALFVFVSCSYVPKKLELDFSICRLAIDPKLGCRVHFPSDVIRETWVQFCLNYLLTPYDVTVWSGFIQWRNCTSTFIIMHHSFIHTANPLVPTWMSFCRDTACHWQLLCIVMYDALACIFRRVTIFLNARYLVLMQNENHRQTVN